MFGLLTVVLCMATAESVFAQSATTAAIAGIAKDATGAVLPGVTVEAASSALIEKVRTAVTDSQGNYKIVDLRPGTYSVTFTLSGFATYRRDGIELTAGFTAAVNAEMKVGALEETVTVTGASPIVDVQNSRAQNLVKAETLDALPTGSRSVMQLAGLTLGALNSSAGRNDVGGDKGEASSGIAIHGSRGDDGRVNLDGMNINNFSGAGGGQNRVYYPNMVAVQEVTIDTGGNTAESEVGGANQNFVPREGGNAFTVYGTANWTNNRFSSQSISNDLTSRGASPFSSVKEIYDYGIGIGGPIRKDKVWFYATNRWWGAESPAANNYFNMSTDWRYYVPDLSRPAYSETYFRDTSLRVTWQVSPKDKVAFEEHRQDGCSCWLSLASGGLSAPEASNDFLYRGNYLTQVSWTRPATNKLLLQASANFLVQQVARQGMSALSRNSFTFVTPLSAIPNAIQVTDQIGFRTPAGNVIPPGYSWNAFQPGGLDYGPGSPNNNYSQRVTASYVTGSHAFKAGLQTLQGLQYNIGAPADAVNQIPGQSISYTFRGGVPVSLTQYATPYRADVKVRSVGLFAQDQWTLKRLTLNVGVRYDSFNGWAPAVLLPAGPFVPARNLPELTNVPDFKDITPRIGVSYDLFGNGKTAIKGSFGRYLLGQGGGFTTLVAPASAIVASVTRTWNDSNGNYVPDCVLTNFAANGECGAINNNAFGQVVPNISVADEARTGWNVREYNYQTSLQLQHELRPGVGVNVGYFQTRWLNQTVTVNTAVTPADFTPYCITAPVDSRLGDVSGSQICGLYNVTPAKQSSVNQVIRLAKNLGLGDPSEKYNGVDVSMTARWGRGAFAMGGVSLGQENLDYCYANGHPELTPEAFPANYPRSSSFCSITNSWWNGTQFKGQAAYPLPLGFQMSGTFKQLPGIPQAATLPLTNAQVAPALGRNLSACPPTATAAACTATVLVALLPSAQAGNSGTTAAKQYDQRLTEVDLRLTKSFRFGERRRIQGILDIYNLFNSRPVQGINSTYGASWLNVTSVLTGRLFKFGTQVDW
jgi:hypothetical protein